MGFTYFAYISGSDFLYLYIIYKMDKIKLDIMKALKKEINLIVKSLPKERKKILKELLKREREEQDKEDKKRADIIKQYQDRIKLLYDEWRKGLSFEGPQYGRGLPGPGG